MTSEQDKRAGLPARPESRPDDDAGIDPPAPGVAVLACRCGAVLDLTGMYRYGKFGNAIVCAECAGRQSGE